MIVSIMMDRGSREKHWADVVQKMKSFEKELGKRKTIYFSGAQPGVVDYALWPTIGEALDFGVVYPELKMPASDELPLFSRWMKIMREHPVVKAAINKDHNLQFIRSCVTGKKNFNAGLE